MKKYSSVTRAKYGDTTEEDKKDKNNVEHAKEEQTLLTQYQKTLEQIKQEFEEERRTYKEKKTGKIYRCSTYQYFTRQRKQE